MARYGSRRRRYRPRRRRRTYGRRKRTGTSRRRLPGGIRKPWKSFPLSTKWTLAPKKKLIVHRYFQAIPAFQTLAAGAINAQAWHANGMFTVDATAGANQPLYFDQASLLYGTWTVLGSKINLQIQRAGILDAGGGNPGDADNNMILAWDRDSLLSLTVRTLAENPKASFASTHPDSIVPTFMSMTFSAKKDLAGVVREKDHYGTQVANPTSLNFFNFYMVNPHGVKSQVYSISCSIRFIALWESQKEVNLS